MRVLDLFSGIGGFSLGLERAAMETVAFCEIDQDATKVLKKHWPDVPVFSDIKELNKNELERTGVVGIDVICGGFPCQDISVAGKQAGIYGERSGLWSEYKRLIGELEPRYVIIENVAALRSNGLVAVLQDLWALGYDAEWHIIPASAVGSPHQRERLWVIAYPECQRPQGQGVIARPVYPAPKAFGEADRLVNALRQDSLPFVCGSHDGVSKKLAQDALKQYGNAVVPQIPEAIGRAIMEASKHKTLARMQAGG